MSRKNKIIVSVVGVLIITLALLGVTYGYFLTRIEGNTNTNSISITTANLRLVYRDGTPEVLTQTNIQPSNETIYTKTFTVTNEGNASIDYEVYLENVINDFVHEEDLLMFITCSSNITGNTCNGYGNVTDDTPTFGTSIYPTVNSKLISNTIEPASEGVDAEVHSYTLYLMFKDDGSDQSDDMGKELKGKIQIYDPKDVVAISGKVTGYDSNYYVELHSDVKTSQIASDGSYIFYGVGTETHTLYVKKKNTNGTISDIGNATISVTKGENASINGNASNIVINDNSEKATVNITIPESKDSITLVGTKVSEPILLKNEILANNTAQSDENINFSEPSSDTNGKGLYYTNTNTIDNKTTYYFIGNVENNYVKFGKYLTNYTGAIGYDEVDSDQFYFFPSLEECEKNPNDYENNKCDEIVFANEGDDIYWQIVRINEDSSIRLLYLGTSTDITGLTASIGTTSTYSPINTIANFYSNQTNLSTYENSHLIQGQFRGDGPEISYEIIKTLPGYIEGDEEYWDEATVYDTFRRIEYRQPEFACTTSNCMTQSYIDEITADEIAYASTNGYIDRENIFFTRSTGGYNYEVYGSLQYASDLGYWYDAVDGHKVVTRPVINLRTDIKLSDEIPSGCTKQDGTASCPYIIDVS